MATAAKSLETFYEKDIEKSNFWEVGQYRHTINRIQNGYKQCDELLAFIKDRAIIEESYCKSLREWTAKHQKIIEKGTAYHTAKTAWLDLLKEADQIALVHLKIRDDLLSDPYEKLKRWKSESYHPLIVGLRETKVFSQEFYIAQKPWLKKSKKFERARKAYFHVCKEELTAITQAKHNEIIAPEKAAKLKQAAMKKTAEKDKIKEKYQSIARDVEKAKDHYADNMERIFSKCQHLEELRLIFFKDIIMSFNSLVDLTLVKSVPHIYHDVKSLISRASPAEDVNWWRLNHGTGMPFYHPTFQQYVQEKDYTFKEFDPQRPHIQDEEKFAVSPTNKTGTSLVPPPRPNSPSVDPWKVPDRSAEVGLSPRPVPQDDAQDLIDSSVFDNGFNSDRTPSWRAFDEEDDDDDNDDEHNTPVLVQAVFSYEGQEDDELTFEKGELFHKLEDEDSQGWCKGKLKNGRVGLYPANFVEVLNQDDANAFPGVASKSENLLGSFSADEVFFSSFDNK